MHENSRYSGQAELFPASAKSGKELASIQPFGGNEEIARELGPLIRNVFRAKAVFLSEFDQQAMRPSGPIELLDGEG